MHVGHARGAFMADAIARLLDSAGHDVSGEYYINDHGRQVENVGRTIHKRYRQLFGDPIELAEGEYPAEYVVAIARRWKDEVAERYRFAPESEWLPHAIDVGIRENMAV